MKLISDAFKLGVSVAVVFTCVLAGLGLVTITILGVFFGVMSLFQ